MIDDDIRVKVGSYKDFISNNENDFETFVFDILTIIKKRLFDLDDQPDSFMAEMSPPQIISSLITNILVNLVDEAIIDAAHYDQKIEMMRGLIEEIGNMSMNGWETTLKKREEVKGMH